MSADLGERAELEHLRRWKAEALPVIAGLQELGRALGLRLGESITGRTAVDAALDLRNERDAARAQVAAVESLLAKEIADDIERNVRSEVAGIRCLDCNLRYEERQEYGCHESGRGHSFDDEDIADAERSARGDAIDYVTLSVSDLRAALGGDGQ